MAVEGDFDRISEYLRSVLALLGKWRVPPTPEMYQVVYAYVSGASLAVRDAIDRALENGKPPTVAFLSDLYERHVRQRQAVVENGISLLNETVTTLEADLDHGYQTILHLDAEFRQAAIPAGVRDLVARLLQENRDLMTKVKTAEARVHAISEELNALRRQASTDVLTGLANRYALDQRIATEDAEGGSSVHVLLFDIDRFKQINDVHGHLVGDQMLRTFAHTVQSVAGQYGIDTADLFRYGGEEIVGIIGGRSNRDVLDFAETVRIRFAGVRLNRKHRSVSTTVSVGVAKRRPREVMRDVIERADRCLYQAKHEGRNRTVFEGRTWSNVRRERPAAKARLGVDG